MKGAFIFNRRVPRTVQADFEAAVARVNLGRSEDAARIVAERLSSKLDQIWSSPRVQPVDTSSLVASITPKAITLEDAVGAYLDQTGRGKGSGFADMSRLAEGIFVSVAGNKDIKLYDRNDARAFGEELKLPHPTCAVRHELFKKTNCHHPRWEPQFGTQTHSCWAAAMTTIDS